MTLRLFLTLCYLLVSSLAFSQKVLVSESEEKVDKTSHKGLSVLLALDDDKVNDAWKRQLKEWGRLEKNGDHSVVTDANIPTISSTPLRLLSKTQTTTKGIKVWLAIDMGDSYITSGHSKYKEAEKVLHDFGIRMYLEDINEQIKDAERAMVKSVREQERMIQKGESIKSNIERNKQEKIRLLQRIEENKIEFGTLQSDSVQNFLNQKLANEEVEKMKKAVEIVRTKLTKVE